MITDYDSLQTEVAAFLDDDGLTDRIKTFIALAEAQLNREIRSWRQEARTTETVNTRFVALPDDWLETARLSIASKYELSLVSDAAIAAMRAATDDESGDPRYYAITAGQIELYPTPSGDETLEHVFLERVPALSDSATTNWVLTYHPDAYLYGALIHSAPYLVEDGRIATWTTLYRQAVEGANREGKRSRHSGSGLKIKVR